MDSAEKMKRLWAAVAFLLALLASGADCLRNVRLELTPPEVAVGDSVLLECLYDLEGAPLYSVKFYRGNREFYRYSPSMVPISRVFPYPGIDVDLSASDENKVLLRRVTRALSGNFSCEVSNDAPYFTTAIVFQRLLVSTLPTADPFLVTEKDKYKVGDLLLANCTASPSRPPALLSFVINGSPVPHTAVISLPTRQEVSSRTPEETLDTPLESSALGLELRLHNHHFKADGSSYLVCIAQVLSLSKRESRPAVLAEPRPTPPPSPQREETIAEPVPERVTSPNHSAISARHPGAPLLLSMALLLHHILVFFSLR